MVVFADDFKTIRAFAEREDSPIVPCRSSPNGGHFASMERPDVIVEDPRTSFRRFA